MRSKSVIAIKLPSVFPLFNRIIVTIILQIKASNFMSPGFLILCISVQACGWIQCKNMIESGSSILTNTFVNQSNTKKFSFFR